MSSDGLACSEQPSSLDTCEITETWLAPSGVPVPPQNNGEINKLDENWNNSLSDISTPSEHFSKDSSLLSENYLVSSDNASLTVCHMTNVTPDSANTVVINSQDPLEDVEKSRLTLSHEYDNLDTYEEPIEHTDTSVLRGCHSE